MPSQRDFVNENLKAMSQYEAALIEPLIKARDAFGEVAIPGIAQNNADITPIKTAYTAEVYEILDSMAKSAIPFFGRLAQAEIKSTKCRFLDTKNDEFTNLYNFWASTRLFEHSQLIANTAANEVTEAVRKLLEVEAPLRDVEGAIRDYSSLSKFQSTMIARTETHQAAMFAKRETAINIQNRTGVEMLKFWNPVEDGRTRPDHAAMNSRKGIGMDEKFMVGGEPMDRPGDSGASASQIINCRCVLTVRPKGF